MRLQAGLFKIEKIFISIHAPVKGATGGGIPNEYASDYFNPRTREGCDLVPGGEHRQNSDFNPRTREGCDVDTILRITLMVKFQSTHP